MAGIQNRNTLQKEIIYAAVQSMHCHPTADVVYEQVRSNHPTISRATVYRVLNQLAENGKITRVPIANGADCFDFRQDDHCHVRCPICGNVSDVELCLDKELCRKASAGTDYRITGYELLFSGICPHCAEGK